MTREIDWQVAQKLGWKAVWNDGMWVLYSSSGEPLGRYDSQDRSFDINKYDQSDVKIGSVAHYSTDLNDAWMLIHQHHVQWQRNWKLLYPPKLCEAICAEMLKK
jgi:hypothetical protein